MGSNTSSTINDFSGDTMAQCASDQNIFVNDITLVFNDGFRLSTNSSAIEDIKRCDKNIHHIEIENIQHENHDDTPFYCNCRWKWEDMQYLIQCCIKGYIPDLKDRIDSVMILIKNIRNDSIKKTSFDALAKSLNAENVIEIYNSAMSHKCDRLVRDTKMYIFGDFENVVKDELFLSLEYDFIIELISSDYLKVKKEDIVFDSLIKWINKDIEKRQKYICCALRHIRFGLLDDKLFLDKFFEICLPCSVCFDIVKDLFTLKFIPERIPKISSNICKPRKRDKTLFRISKYDRTDTKKIEFYDVNNKTWTFFSNIELNLKHPSIVTFFDRIVIIGGKNNSNECTNQVWCISIEKKENIAMPPILEKRFLFASASVKNDILICGGQNKNDKFMSSVEKWNSFEGLWKFMNPMKIGRSMHVAIACKNEVYAIGGFSEGTHTNSVEKYNFEQNQWEDIKPLKYARQDHAAAVLNDNIYVVGGFADSLLSSCEMLHTEAGCWSEIKNLPSPQFGNAVGFYNDLVFFGNNETNAYNIKKNVWESYPSTSQYIGLMLEYKVSGRPSITKT